MILSLEEWLKTNEEQLVPTASDANVNWGVKGKFKSNKDDNRKFIVNPDEKIIKDDKKVLNDIISKIDANIGSLGDLEKYLESYSKINGETLNSVITKLKSFKESISNEIKNIK